MDQLVEIGTQTLEELNRTFALNTYLMNKSVEAGLLPTMRYLFGLEQDVAGSMLAALRREKSLRVGLRDLYHKTRAGARYDRLVRTFGAELFGSATFAGETVLAENDYLRLSHLPAAAGSTPRGVSLFHVGGFLPYSDRIFRMLPEANLFTGFLSRGMPVYAMELRPDAHAGRLKEVTLERFIDDVDRMTDVAFHHAQNGGRKMIAEGYCGLGMPTLAYVAARPERAEAKLAVVATMVAPVDGRRCTMLGDFIKLAPQALLDLHAARASIRGGRVKGDDLRTGLDIPLGAVVYKSPLGRFATGWGNPVYAYLDRVEDLDLAQRRELAGAYWISAQNSRRSPMPLDLVRFFGRLFREGIDNDLTIPATYRGAPLSLRAVAERTSIRVVGFYGGRDLVVPDVTAGPLARALGARYTHVVHPRAGHISYVLSPELWDPGHPRALDPSPIDLMLALHAAGDE